MVVGRGHRHDLLRADHRADRAQPDGVGDRAGRDDRALPDHQPRNRRDRADPARVGQRDVAADEVVGAQRVRPRLLDERVVGLEELGEAEPAGVADHRHHQRAAPVLLLDVDGQAEVDRAVVDPVRLAVDLGEVVGHDRHVRRPHARDRVGDQMGERDPVARVLELLATLVERGHGHRPERGGGRDRAALVHVAGQGRGPSPERLRFSYGGGPFRGRLFGFGCRGRAVAGCRQHVGLGDPPAAGGPDDAPEVDPLAGGDPPGDRGDVGAVAVRHVRRRLGRLAPAPMAPERSTRRRSWSSARSPARP